MPLFEVYLQHLDSMGHLRFELGYRHFHVEAHSKREVERWLESLKEGLPSASPPWGPCHPCTLAHRFVVKEITPIDISCVSTG